MKTPTISEVIADFREKYGITITEEQAKEHIAFYEKTISECKFFELKKSEGSEELSDDEAEAVAGGVTAREAADRDKVDPEAFKILNFCEKAPIGYPQVHMFFRIAGRSDAYRCNWCRMCITSEMTQYVERRVVG